MCEKSLYQMGLDWVKIQKRFHKHVEKAHEKGDQATSIDEIIGIDRAFLWLCAHYEPPKKRNKVAR